MPAPASLVECLTAAAASCADVLLDPALLQGQGYLREERIHQIWHEHLAARDHTPRLWSLLTWQA